ncbi:MAG: hypothetical protein KAR23_04855, partial [Candidatus Aenigmarchaeota archaeon]|nr:hypothetical protein [Candidatus Aenigmarchaeota archaeon]
MLLSKDKESEFYEYVTNNYDMFIDDDVFGSDFVTSVFEKLDMCDKSASVRKKLFLDYESINIRLDLEKEYSSLFSEEDYGLGYDRVFKALFFYDLALRMYDVLGSFSGPDNPFFDESDSVAVASLIRRVSFEGDIDDGVCSDYGCALGIAADFLKNSKESLICDISDSNYTSANSFTVSIFYEGWISSFFSSRRVKMNVFVDNIYIDDMRAELNGISTSKLGSEEEKVVTSLKMPMSCRTPDTGAYYFQPEYSRFN